MDRDVRYSEADVHDALKKGPMRFRSICFTFYNNNVGSAKDGLWKVMDMFGDVEKYKDLESGEESYRILAPGQERKNSPKISERWIMDKTIDLSRAKTSDEVITVKKDTEAVDEEAYKEKIARQACWKLRYEMKYKKKLVWPRMALDIWLKKFEEEHKDLTYPPKHGGGKKAGQKSEYFSMKERVKRMEAAKQETTDGLLEDEKESAVGKINRARFTEVNESLMAQIPEKPSRSEDYLILRKNNEIMVRALQEITKKMGSYNRDPLKHAENVIENMAEIAEKVLEEVKIIKREQEDEDGSKI